MKNYFQSSPLILKIVGLNSFFKPDAAPKKVE